MLKKDVKVGGKYLAKVNGVVRTVRVDRISDSGTYHVTNLATGRQTTFRSAAKFRGVAPEKKEAEHRPDPTPVTSARQLVSAPTADAVGTAEDREDTLLGRMGEDAVSPVTAKLHAAVAKALPNPAGEVMLSLTGDGRTLTQEQSAILRLAHDVFSRPGKGRVIVIKAKAGSGKTYECQQLEMVMQQLLATVQYMAFNRSLIDDGRAKFRWASVNTTYSLAFKECGRKYAHRLKGNRVRSDEIARLLGLEGMHVELEGQINEDDSPKTKWLKPGNLAWACIEAIKRFCQSADRELALNHFGYIDGVDAVMERDDGSKRRGHRNNDMLKRHLLPFARKLWADLSNPDGTLPLPSLMHGTYFKVWQLGNPVIAAQVILLDEYQDTAPVLVDVLKQQAARGSMVVLVGDDDQRIYEFTGAINAGDEFPEASVATLSQSFRNGPAVADVANAVLGTLEMPTDTMMRGFDRIPTRVYGAGSTAAVPAGFEAKCFLYRTNAGAVGRMMRGIADGKRGHLIGGGADVVAFCKAAIDLQEGKPTDHPELCCFTSWKEVEAFSETEEGDDLRLMCKLIKAFTAEAIRDALEHMPDERDADFIACTAHKSKGREWRSVKLGADFPTKDKLDDSGRRLLYVACTRAQEELDLTECPPFCGGESWGGEDGEESEWVPGLKVTWTQLMPTEDQLVTYRAAKAEETTSQPSKHEEQLVKAGEAKNGMPDPLLGNGGHLQQNGGEDFTWAKPEGEWLIRGAANMVGKTVTVTRRNGTTSKETLRRAVKKLGDLWFYSNR